MYNKKNISKLILRSIKDIDCLVWNIQEALNKFYFVGISGNIGVGKTRLIKRFMTHLLKRSYNDLRSPTFNIIHRYRCSVFSYHIDCYKLKLDGFENYYSIFQIINRV